MWELLFGNHWCANTETIDTFAITVRIFHAQGLVQAPVSLWKTLMSSLCKLDPTDLIKQTLTDRRLKPRQFRGVSAQLLRHYIPVRKRMFPESF